MLTMAERVNHPPTLPPVVHGRWRESGPLLECQSCGEIYSRLGGNAGKLWNYCPNCGAKTAGGIKLCCYMADTGEMRPDFEEGECTAKKRKGKGAK